MYSGETYSSIEPLWRTMGLHHEGAPRGLAAVDAEREENGGELPAGAERRIPVLHDQLGAGHELGYRPLPSGVGAPDGAGLLGGGRWRQERQL